MATTQNAGKKRRTGARGATDDGGVASGRLAPERLSPHRGGLGPALTRDAGELLDLYVKMVDIRAFEEGTSKGFRTGKIGGYLHTYIGQEAVATGFLDAHRKGDKVITAYRDHAHAILLGSDPKAVMAELYGKGTGLVAGKGGSMHLFDAANDMMGGYGIVGGHIPLGVGMAYALRYQGTDNIVQLYLGTARSTTAPSTRRPTWPACGGRRG
jgi:pyruvate dehydrogenase E1 component alpha subunit